MITFKENTKDNAENLSVSRLSLPQEINILSGIMLLISVPLGIAAAFSAKLDAAVFVYKIGVFCYLFWFCTSCKVYGVLADKGQKKYRRLDFISIICAALFSMFFVLLAYLAVPMDNAPVSASFWSNLTIFFYVLSLGLSIIVFSICQYLAVLITMLDIRKNLIR